jgi:predicted HD superfamily hydrolase involved in NAD metabolism
LAVARWAKDLAGRHGVDPEGAWRAGLLHDCAKEWSASRLLAVGTPLLKDPADRAFFRRTRRGHLLHAEVSAREARRRYGLRDRAALQAIARHTLAGPDMTPLDRVIFVADFSSTDRTYAAARRVRRLARRDLTAAYRDVLREKFLHVLRVGEPLHPGAVARWNEAFS